MKRLHRAWPDPCSHQIVFVPERTQEHPVGFREGRQAQQEEDQQELINRNDLYEASLPAQQATQGSSGQFAVSSSVLPQ